jgi:hypothetical protein
MSTASTCSLPLFTWTRIQASGTNEVIPVCPKHGQGKVRCLVFGYEVNVICDQGYRHFLRTCSLKAYREEQEIARAKLYPSATGARP